MERLQLLSERGQSQHDRSEGDGGPVAREQGPCGGSGREPSEIGMSVEQRLVRNVGEKLPPPVANEERVQIEDSGAEREQDAGGQDDAVAGAARRHELLKIDSDQVQA